MRHGGEPASSARTLIRRLRWLAAAAILLGASYSHAAGLSVLTLRSSLGQPLHAEIEVASLRKDERLTAVLASQAAYKEAGLPYPGALTDARFVLQSRASGEAYLQVTTTGPINVRQLELLVDVDSTYSIARGHYSLQFGPGASGVAVFPTMAFSVPRSAPATIAQPAPPPRESPRAAPAEPARVPEQARAPPVAVEPSAAAPPSPQASASEPTPVPPPSTQAAPASPPAPAGPTIRERLSGLFGRITGPSESPASKAEAPPASPVETPAPSASTQVPVTPTEPEPRAEAPSAARTPEPPAPSEQAGTGLRDMLGGLFSRFRGRPASPDSAEKPPADPPMASAPQADPVSPPAPQADPAPPPAPQAVPVSPSVPPPVAAVAEPAAKPAPTAPAPKPIEFAKAPEAAPLQPKAPAKPDSVKPKPAAPPATASKERSPASVSGAAPGRYGALVRPQDPAEPPEIATYRKIAGLSESQPVTVPSGPPPNIERAPLVSAFRQAQRFDPQYQGAVAERTYNESLATAARWAYAPEMQYGIRQAEIEDDVRRTLTVSQPVFAPDRLFTWREAAPRSALAGSTFSLRENDLAQRVLRAVTELVRAREGMRVNEQRMDLLAEQAKRARRLYELGEGTRTDMIDAAVRFEQARATQLGLVTRASVAEEQYAAIVGKPPPKGAFGITQVPRRTPLEPAEHYGRRAQEMNPNVVTARQNERIAELGASRAKWSFAPTVSATAVQTEIPGRSRSYFGAAVTFPLQAQQFTNVTGAAAQADRARENTRQTTQTLQVDVDRLRALVDSGQQELVIRKNAIDAAELAIEANIKSQQGGIRTTVDVLNAIQTLADVNVEYVNTAATLAENYLLLLLQAAYEPAEALARVQRLAFEQ